MWGSFSLFVLVVGATQGQDDIDILCSQEYCANFLKDNTCVSLPKSCNKEDSSDDSSQSGLFLPFPGPCNCCDYCLSIIPENGQCATGSPSSPTPTSICGDGLSCASEGAAVCQRIKSPCTEAQDAYDGKRQDGSLGHLEVRPLCNRNGEYEPYVCIPGETCFCVSEDGKRIFGEIEYSDNVESLMNCGCSRNYNTAVQLIGSELIPSEHFRCTSTGDYDELQCIGNDCYCVDSVTGNPTTENPTAVNISLISATTLDCFDNKLHESGGYFRQCESLYLLNLLEVREHENDGFEVLGFDFPACQLDGYYGSVQHNLTTKFCTDPQGNILENFAVELTNDLANGMNCKCARARSIITSDEKPTCCLNGNYASVQCRRGMCRCVNSDGVQIEKEVHYSIQETLPCFSNTCTRDSM